MRQSVFLLIPFLSMASTANSEVFTAANTAMGGVGVASSKIDSAAYNNPALLTRPKGSKTTAITIPSIGAEFSAKEEIVDTFDNIDGLVSAFENDIDTLAGTVEQFDVTGITDPIVLENALNDKLDENFDNVSQSQNDILDVLAEADSMPIVGRASALFSVATIVNNWSFALDKRVGVMGLGEVNYAEEDRVTLQDAIDEAQQTAQDEIADAVQDTINGDPISSDVALNFELNDLNTTVNFSGVIIDETVLSVARNFNFKGHDFSVGVSPKLVEVDTYFYSQGAENTDTDNLEINDYRNNSSSVNIDAGLAYFLSDSITAGIVFRDLISREFTTVTENGQSDKYQTKLSSTLGIALSKPFYSVALDVDLIPISEFESVKDSHFVRVGAELDAWGWAQFRAGARVDLNAERENVISAGINLSPFNTVHLGLSGWSDGSNVAGFAADFKVLL